MFPSRSASETRNGTGPCRSRKCRSKRATRKFSNKPTSGKCGSATGWVTEWEDRIATQFKALKKFAQTRGCFLKPADLPPRLPRATPGREVTVHSASRRVWKSTIPGNSGFGPFGYQTPAGYLRRLRLSNLIFGDDVAFEGVLVRKEELNLATSQSYIQPHPVRFIPTEGELQALLADLGFGYAESAVLWCRDDVTQLGDTHDRNFIRASDESIIAIDVQPPVVARTRLRLTDTQNKKARTTGRAFLS